MVVFRTWSYEIRGRLPPLLRRPIAQSGAHKTSFGSILIDFKALTHQSARRSDHCGLSDVSMMSRTTVPSSSVSMSVLSTRRLMSGMPKPRSKSRRS